MVDTKNMIVVLVLVLVSNCRSDYEPNIDGSRSSTQNIHEPQNDRPTDAGQTSPYANFNWTNVIKNSPIIRDMVPKKNFLLKQMKRYKNYNMEKRQDDQSVHQSTPSRRQLATNMEFIFVDDYAQQPKMEVTGKTGDPSHIPKVSQKFPNMPVQPAGPIGQLLETLENKKEESPKFEVHSRLQKLDYYFERLNVLSEDCRQRMLCEAAKDPNKFYPLSNILYDETSFNGNYRYLTSQLINTTEGARLLSYMEATFRGQDRARKCDVFEYRCPSRTEEMINLDSLSLWREMIRWLTIHVISRNP